MKTETKIAEVNIILYDKTNKGLVAIGICSSHKASCQREFAFLQALRRGQQKWLTYQLLIISKKTVDLENAIKKYKENGI